MKHQKILCVDIVGILGCEEDDMNKKKNLEFQHIYKNLLIKIILYIIKRQQIHKIYSI